MNNKEIDEYIINILKERFLKNPHRHKGIEWEELELIINASDRIAYTIYEMEKTGGEPDLLFLKDQNIRMFVDFSKETPKGRINLCYDKSALDARKENKPLGSAVEMAHDMGIEILNENDYRTLQEVENVDLKTSSWIITPKDIRKLGGALFCDRRYNTVFVYHNGAQSYYSSRGFRGKLQI
jgi:hypothetical protein